MKEMADQYFRKIGDEFQNRDTPLGAYRLNLLEREDWGEENKLLTTLQHEEEKLEENLTATYWG